MKEENSRWYAVYTKPRNEKKLTTRLNEKGIEAYLPLRKTLKQWSDRKKMVEEPLISSYVFVNVDKQNYYEVLNTDGAVKYIWFSGKPAAIPPSQIDLLKKITRSGEDVECISENFEPGQHVKVSFGPLAGLTGELVAVNGRKKLLIRLENLDKSLVLTINPALVEKISE